MNSMITNITSEVRFFFFKNINQTYYYRFKKKEKQTKHNMYLIETIDCISFSSFSFRFQPSFFLFIFTYSNIHSSSQFSNRMQIDDCIGQFFLQTLIAMLISKKNIVFFSFMFQMLHAQVDRMSLSATISFSTIDYLSSNFIYDHHQSSLRTC